MSGAAIGTTNTPNPNNKTARLAEPWVYRTPGWGGLLHKDGDGEGLFHEFKAWVNEKMVVNNRKKILNSKLPTITTEGAVAMSLQKMMLDKLGEIKMADTAAAVPAGAAGAAGGVPPPLPTTAEHLAKRLAYFESKEFVEGFSGATRLLGQGIVSRQGKSRSTDSSYSAYIQAVFNTSAKDIRAYFEGSGVGCAQTQCQRALPWAVLKWKTASNPDEAKQDPELICYICGEPMFNIANTGRKWCNTSPPPTPMARNAVAKTISL